VVPKVLQKAFNGIFNARFLKNKKKTLKNVKNVTRIKKRKKRFFTSMVYICKF